MVTRRRMLAGLAATSLLPSAGWSSVGTPDYLSAARAPDGTFLLAGLTTTGEITFTIPLPARGHTAAAHPERAEAVAFARRPGTFALVMDCRDGAVLKTLTAPESRHFYGHGTFSADGTALFTSENDYEGGEGVIGVWDVTRNYARIGEFSSGGVGPHDLKLMPNGKALVVANGGIETHPDMGRSKLNIPVMAPNLSYLSPTGTPLEKITLTAALHKNSIRHLAVRQDGMVAFAMQWQGSKSATHPLLGLHQRGTEVKLLTAPPKAQQHLQGYAGSVALSNDGNLVAITSPRGNVLHVFDTGTGQPSAILSAKDVCGIGPTSDGFVFTTGTGIIGTLQSTTAQHALQWDNHLIAITP
ncbi:MAG: DUF1513 domain-containing protein [Shimia sp.]|uniref:DUF1513 domain-containing protein n=1 Tax=Shimia sp. TaxID=1954381 RepID=UPI0025DEAD2F|nr:DUF1513 domain-containing protein [Shimia sp.]MCH2068494.1 DUF1513 domain-containing protein [Shimia sp.]